ncbi:MAG TPA: IS200/IS605 family transposase [Capsulimonadaceae bacterium]|jgi:REP element-mobilizing transposase RayT
MAHSYSEVYIHLIFATKQRERMLHDGIRDEMHRYMTAIIAKRRCRAVIVNSVEDHVHILLDLARTTALADIVEEIKGSSSRLLKSKGADLESFGWQTGYGAFSISPDDVDGVKRYIVNQREHHRSVSFEDEFLAALAEHGVEYDERYLWE